MNALELLTLTIEQKCGKDQPSWGIWLAGIEREGDKKLWWPNGRLWGYSQWKNGRLHGEFKTWSRAGRLVNHELYQNGNLIKDYLPEFSAF